MPSSSTRSAANMPKASPSASRWTPTPRCGSSPKNGSKLRVRAFCSDAFSSCEPLPKAGRSPDGVRRFALLISRSAIQFRQFSSGLQDHVDPSLEFVLQLWDIHLVGDTVRIANPLHIALLHHFLETSYHRHSRQFERSGNRACADRRAHEGPKKHIDPNGSYGAAIAVGSEFGAVVVTYAADQTDIQPAEQESLACKLDPRRWPNFIDKDKGEILRVEIGKRLVSAHATNHGTYPSSSTGYPIIERALLSNSPFTTWRASESVNLAVVSTA